MVFVVDSVAKPRAELERRSAGRILDLVIARSKGLVILFVQVGPYLRFLSLSVRLRQRDSSALAQLDHLIGFQVFNLLDEGIRSQRLDFASLWVDVSRLARARNISAPNSLSFASSEAEFRSIVFRLGVFILWWSVWVSFIQIDHVVWIGAGTRETKCHLVQSIRSFTEAHRRTN